MQGDGVDVTRWTESDFHRMCDRVESMVKKKHVRRFTGNDYTSDLSKGDVLACQAYSGDAIQLQADNPDIEFVVPEEGAELWAESLLVPNLARHKANAEALIDFYYDPEVAAELAASVNYVCPVAGRPRGPGRSRGQGDRRTGREPADLPRRGHAPPASSWPGTSPRPSAAPSPGAGTPSSDSDGPAPPAPSAARRMD